MLEKCVNYVSKLTEIMHPIVIKKNLCIQSMKLMFDIIFVSSKGRIDIFGVRHQVIVEFNYFLN